jgi:arginyl-tRNA synthetase
VTTTRDLVEQQIRAAAKARLDYEPVTIEVAAPQQAEHGDYSTNLAMQAARDLKRPPRDIAAALVEGLTSDGLIARAEVAGPGFVNVWLEPPYVENSVDTIRAAGLEYGRSQASRPKSINVEFVSANPTGPLTVGNARGAFVGDLLCRVLEAVGHKTTREYYFNDNGSQVERLGQSVLAVAAGREVPEDGYHGDYVTPIANELPADLRAQADAEPDKAGWIVGAWASERIRAGIERSLQNLGVRFDVWKGEGSLHTEGWVKRGVEQLTSAGYMHEHDGALWFKSTSFGDDKDRVVIRSNGDPTYFASDIGYVVEKFSRGFDELIYIWGADHHGTVARLKNAAEALGLNRDAVNVLLIAWVRFVRNGEEVSMSKRSGEFVTLDELLDEVGVDAARWFFASRAPSSTSTSSWPVSSRARTPSTTSSMPTRGSARFCAKPPTPGYPRARRSTAAWQATTLLLGWPRTCCACRTSSATRPRLERPRRSRPSRRTWRQRFTPSTATGVSSIRPIRRRLPIDWRWSMRHAPRSRPRSAYSESRRPNRCSRKSKTCGGSVYWLSPRAGSGTGSGRKPGRSGLSGRPG